MDDFNKGNLNWGDLYPLNPSLGEDINRLFQTITISEQNFVNIGWHSSCVSHHYNCPNDDFKSNGVDVDVVTPLIFRFCELVQLNFTYP
ncbi:hypothetical protein CHUAL_011218 [Chamberlinius hualienensis]